MKILYVLDFFYPYRGGVSYVFHNLAKELVKKGHDITVITSLAGTEKKFEVVDGIKVYRFGKGRFPSLVSMFFKLLFWRERYDLVHTSTYQSIIPTYFYSKLKGTPKAVTIHEVWSLKEWLEFLGWKGFFYFLEERILLLFPFDFYLMPSRHTKEDAVNLAGIPSEKSKVIPHGIEGLFSPGLRKYRKQIRGRYKIPDDMPTGFFSSKATTFKGIYYLLDAVEMVAGKTNNIKFIFFIYKDREYEKFVNRIEKTDSLKKSIILVTNPDREDLAKYIAASDFALVPSLTEGFCLAAADYASVGVPVIAFKNSCLPEVLDERTTIFVRSRDSEQLAEAILKLSTDKRLRKRMSKRKRFNTWSTIAKEYENLYQKLIND
jgi:glycosyltransferase involved in cell wall biosynthesis